ncbi:MAG: hypothetical protein HFG37_12610 [Eubacterium sp.]|nr:hypothetical protein [Eubacterium sp.]
MKKNWIKKISVICLASSLSLAMLSSTAEAKYNTDKASRAAQKKVPGATITEVEMDMDDGKAVVEVSLIKKNKKYSLKYRHSDNKLIEYEWELPNTSYSIQNKKNVSMSKIKTKARKLVKGSKIISARLSVDDGLSEYKLSLKKGKRQYKLVYNAKNGKLLEYEWKQLSSSSSPKGYIGESKARNIALKKAPGATITKFEFDKDDGIAVYEVELRKGIYEYEVKINAATGAIIEFEKEIED